MNISTIRNRPTPGKKNPLLLPFFTLSYYQNFFQHGVLPPQTPDERRLFFSVTSNLTKVQHVLNSDHVLCVNFKQHNY